MTSSLKTQIKNKKIIFAIYGLGNVGGPIAAAWLKAGAKVIGVDISKKLLDEINSCPSCGWEISKWFDIQNERIRRGLPVIQPKGHGKK